MDWCETLPKDCPIKNAFAPKNQSFYRFCENSPPKEEDFLPFKLKRELKKDKENQQCIECSLSIWETKEACMNAKRLPAHKSEKVKKIVLNINDGMIAKTFSQYHYSWWRTKQFIINSAV
jgi:hypothetical protein